MFKFYRQGRVYQARNVEDALQQCGLAFPDGIDPVNYFVVRLWVWDPNEKDYVIASLNGPTYLMFNEYTDALDHYQKMAAEYAYHTGENEVKLELAHCHRGDCRILESKIIFPAVLAHEA